jgi:hypothetical protein
MRWLLASFFFFVLSNFGYSENPLFRSSFQAMSDKEILVKTVKKMPEHQFIDRLSENGVLFDLKELKKMGSFERVNFATLYAYECGKRKLWEEVIDVLEVVKGDIKDCVDPARFFFTKATAEFMLGKKRAAEEALDDLDDTPNTTQRYTNLAMLMRDDMKTWNEQDLGYLNRKMREIADRLDNGQGGKKTQKMQREILVRLDEMIKKNENDKKGSANQKQCPDGGKKEQQESESQSSSAKSNRVNKPAEESGLDNGQAAGIADKKVDGKLVQDWGNLPEKERAAAEQALERRVPEKYHSTIKNYLRVINNKSSK